MSIPIRTILNDPPQRPDTPVSNGSASAASSPVSETTGEFSSSKPKHARAKKSRDTSDLSYTRPTGVIKYPAYENQDDEVSMRLMEPFEIFPFGTIQHWSANIPYSSDKKDLKTKTGREKLEVFCYRFTDPNDKEKYDVMWDFRGGYVRISPFFKNAKYKKTGPGKMLDANPGMRDVTTQITGGNRIAQGYWVHMLCARAVCATFCYNIRGALIPIFGPDFPNDCIRPNQHGFNCMAIDPNIIREAEIEVKAYRITGRPLAAVTSHPQRPVEDQYAGSPMEHYAMQRHSEGQYFSQNVAYGPSPYGPSPPHYHTPASAYPREYDCVGARATPELGYYKEPSTWPSTAAFGPSNTRPPSSGSEISLYGMSQSPRESHPRASLLRSPAELSTHMPDPHPEPLPRVEKRRIWSEPLGHKRRRTNERFEYPKDNERSFAMDHGDESDLSPDLIDPNLEAFSEKPIVNNPRAMTVSPESSAPQTPETSFRARDYESAAILVIMANSPSNAQAE